MGVEVYFRGHGEVCGMWGLLKGREVMGKMRIIGAKVDRLRNEED